jgi:hypothetical protein
VLVSPPLIDAQDDDLTGTPVIGSTGGPAGNIYADNGSDNDTLGGIAAGIAGLTNITISNDGGLASVSIADDGTISVPAGTPAGTYLVEYVLCEDLNPGNCDNAVVTVVVNAPLVLAQDDDLTGTPVNGADGGAAGNVYANNGSGTDTLNGTATGIIGLTTITVTNDAGLTGVTIADNGTLIVPAGTPAGTYLVEYQLCEDLNPANCDFAIATVLVDAPAINALDDDFSATPVNGAVGGTAGNVYADNGSGADCLNGAGAGIDGLTTITVLVGGGLAGVTIDDAGNVIVPAATPAGTYLVQYQLCEDLNSANCDTAIATVVVGTATILAEDDDLTATPVNGTSGGPAGNVYADNGSGPDTLDGTAAGLPGLSTSA